MVDSGKIGYYDDDDDGDDDGNQSAIVYFGSPFACAPQIVPYLSLRPATGPEAIRYRKEHGLQ